MLVDDGDGDKAQQGFLFFFFFFKVNNENAIRHFCLETSDMVAPLLAWPCSGLTGGSSGTPVSRCPPIPRRPTAVAD